jgi:hypothetical protein
MEKFLLTNSPITIKIFSQFKCTTRFNTEQCPSQVHFVIFYTSMHLQIYRHTTDLLYLGYANYLRFLYRVMVLYIRLCTKRFDICMIAKSVCGLLGSKQLVGGFYLTLVAQSQNETEQNRSQNQPSVTYVVTRVIR